MALARSASAGGGLSINTGTANSLFGSNPTSQAPATGGLFGGAAKPATGGLFGSTTPATTQSGGLFGSAPAASQPAQSGGLFGASTATSQPAQSGGLFGASMASSQPQQSGGLFGSAPAATSQPQQSGGLFGGSAPTQPQAQQNGGLFGGAKPAQPAATGGGLFGSSAAQPAQQSGGLFGNNNATQQQQPAQSGGLFGQSQAKPATLFGSTAQPQQQQQQTTFGNTLGGLTMGQSTSQPTVPGVKIDISQLRTTTRFTDLHQDLQTQIETIDRNIQAIMHQKHDIDAILPSHGEKLNNVPYDVDYCLRKLTQAQNGLEEDAEAIAYVKELNLKDAENAKLSFRAVDNLKLPAQYHSQGIWSTSSTSGSNSSSDPSNPSDLVSYFSAQADEMAKTLEKYQKNVLEIEQHLRGVEASSMSQLERLSGNGGRQQQMLELVSVFREFENGIMGVAEDVSSVREGVTSLQKGHSDTGAGFGRRSGVY